jgi:hypothetical protein
MMRLEYAGGAIVTGSAITNALLRYAAALARAETAISIDVPGRTVHGVEGTFQMLLGPSSQILVEPTDDPDELVNEEFLADLEQRIDRLERPPFVVPWDEPPEIPSVPDQL